MGKNPEGHDHPSNTDPFQPESQLSLLFLPPKPRIAIFDHGRPRRHLFARDGSSNVTSLIFAIAVVVVCFLPNWLLWRKKIFLKI
jgi:hypothetical protein